MSKQIVIDPVTRIEGHAKITINLNEEGQVSDARFHVVEFRGFEKFCEGRPMTEMPSLTGRICGICPVSHLMASAKAGDAILSVKIPPAADKLRRLMNLGQMLQSHALSFFYLSAPDFLLGWDSDPASRNVFGLIKADKELARKGIRVRQHGQEIIEHLGGRRVHPAWAVPGGVRSSLTQESRDYLSAKVAETKETILLATKLFKDVLKSHEKELQICGNFPSLYLSLIGEDGQWEHHGGSIRVSDSAGNIIADNLDPANYQDYIGEATESYSYLKFPYYKPMGYPDGIYRVGPLARINNCEKIGTPLADAELQEYKNTYGTGNSSFLYHYARLIEMMASAEYIEMYLNDPDIMSDQIRAGALINSRRGVGVSEAPRGTLFHDYEVDKDGILTNVNLIIATGQNNLPMNRTVTQIAKTYITDGKITEGVLNRIEHGIRCYDPCLSCSTHAYGTMPMHVELVAADGTVVDEILRD